jgi:hypothetical protein
MVEDEETRRRAELSAVDLLEKLKAKQEEAPPSR